MYHACISYKTRLGFPLFISSNMKVLASTGDASSHCYHDTQARFLDEETTNDTGLASLDVR